MNRARQAIRFLTLKPGHETMVMKFLARFLSLTAAAAMLIGASGCGLGDYQRRMDEQRARVQDFDEANRVLDDPVERPKIQIPEKLDAPATETPAWPFDPFLRLPKGYGTTFKDKGPYNNFFFRYTGGREGAHAVFLAAASVVDPKGKEEFGSYMSATFLSYVKPALERYLLDTYKAPIALKEKAKPERREVKVVTPYPDPAGISKLSYTLHTYTDEGNANLKEHTAFDCYVHERGGRQMCIAVHRPLQPSSGALKTSIEASLGSLDITPDAAAKRAEYKKAKGS